MNKTKHSFQSGVIVGVIGSLSVVGLSYAGQYFYQAHQKQQVIKHIEAQKQQFVAQLNQQYLNQSKDSAQQLMILLRQSSQIQKEIVANLKVDGGVNLHFDRMLLTAEIQPHKKIPAELARHKFFYQPQFQNGQPITAWQCFSTLDDDLRPKDCLYRQEAPENTELLRQALMAAVSETRRQYDHRSTHTPPVETECGKFKAKLPQDFDVFATGAYSGRDSRYQIDDSGHQANEMDIYVQHNRPTVLILGAYEPTIWNLKWEANTHIVGVIATGYHAQRVLGLPNSVPVLETTAHNSQCGYSYVSNENAATLNQLSQKILQKDIKTVVVAQNGRANIGNIGLISALKSSNDKTINDIIDKSAPLAGQAGIDDAVAKGLLRQATRADIQAWKAAYNKANNIHTPPVVGGTESSGTGMEYVHFDSAYVVLKEMTIPAGLYGAHSVTLFVPKDVPRPKGNPGHSTIYDMGSGGCYGSSPDCLRN